MNDEFLDQIVFSTFFVIKKGSPVVSVFHDLDGTWQFFGSEKNITTDDGAVLFMKEIIALDVTLLQALNIPKGYVARRDFIGGEWRISIQEE